MAGGADRQHPDAAEAGRSSPAGAGLLALATGTFYPDFFAKLNDGRVLLVEYKGEHLVEHEQQKKNIGERWESTSGGKALFFWAVKKDEHGRDVRRQLEDKLGKSCRVFVGLSNTVSGRSAPGVPLVSTYRIPGVHLATSYPVPIQSLSDTYPTPIQHLFDTWQMPKNQALGVDAQAGVETVQIQWFVNAAGCLGWRGLCHEGEGKATSMRHHCDIKATPKRVDSQRIGTPTPP